MQQLSAWVGAGFVTAGVTAAFFAGSGVATADTGSDSGSSSSSSSDSSDSSSSSTDNNDKPDAAAKPDPADKPEKPTPDASSDPDATDNTEPDDTKPDDTKPDDTKPDDHTSEVEEPAPSSEPEAEPEPEPEQEPAEEPIDSDYAASTPKPVSPKKDAFVSQPVTAEAAPVEEIEEPVLVVEPDVTAVENVATTREKTQEDQPLTATSLSEMRAAQTVVSTMIAPPSPPSLFEAIGTAIGAFIGSIVVNVGSFAINALQTVEALVTGPPVLPPNSTVTVRSSTITLSNGQRVAANWYYPEGDVPPDRMILLNHGFLALGPMYSFTAANLAEKTRSIVVTPSLPSNFFAADNLWLGGIGMAGTIADLFVGDREALTQSAINAGFATRYGLDPATAALPLKFGLAGHSLGGQLVSGVAGFLAEKGAADNLVGVITLDGVPLGTTLADAIDKLDAYEAAGGHYIPIREIGAPTNLFNSLSNVKESLNEGRPGRYNGVVLAGGVHMDSMLGGNPIIQFAAYLAAGFPQAQNPPAVEQLAVTWFNQWFEGQTAVGDDLLPGSTIDIVTPKGVAKGVVMGAPPAAGSTSSPAPLTLAASSPTAIPRLEPHLAALSA